MENGQERGRVTMGIFLEDCWTELLVRKQIQRASCAASLATPQCSWSQPQPSLQGSKDKRTLQIMSTNHRWMKIGEATPVVRELGGNQPYWVFLWKINANHTEKQSGQNWFQKMEVVLESTVKGDIWWTWGVRPNGANAISFDLSLTMTHFFSLKAWLILCWTRIWKPTASLASWNQCLLQSWLPLGKKRI